MTGLDTGSALFVFAAIDQVISPESVDQSIPEPDQARLVVDSPSEAPSPTPSELENFFLNKNEIVDIDGSSFGYVNVESEQANSCTKVRGRLRENITFWQSIGTNRWLLEIIREGYCLPFVEMPARMDFLNHKSALKESEMVAEEIRKLLVSGALEEVEADEVTVCSPLGVVTVTMQPNQG